MISSGLLALLTLQFVKHFLTTSATLDHYYKAYYMARGGVEAMLTEENLRGYGFQYSITDSSPLMANYTTCNRPGLCHLQGNIVSQGESINNTLQSLTSRACAPEAMIVLQPGQSSAYPLFYDRGEARLSFTPVSTSDYERDAHVGYSMTLSGGKIQA